MSQTPANGSGTLPDWDHVASWWQDLDRGWKATVYGLVIVAMTFA